MDTDFIQKAIQNTLDHPANNLSSTSKDLLETCVNQLKVKTEPRVFLINYDTGLFFRIQNPSDEEFMTEAERQGTVYTLEGFVKAFNVIEINTNHHGIRIIDVPVSL